MDHLEQISDVFGLLGEPNRLKILLTCLDQPLCVGDIAEKAGISPSLTSHHLRLLKAARLVKAAREGKHIYYEAADDHVRCIITDMVEHIGETVT